MLNDNNGHVTECSLTSCVWARFLTDSHTLPGQRHSQPHFDFDGSRVYACLGVTCHLHFWQNDRGLLRAIAVTRGWNGQWMRVSTQSWFWRRKFSRCSCRDSNSPPFDHEFGALTNKLSRLNTVHPEISTYQLQKGNPYQLFIHACAYQL